MTDIPELLQVFHRSESVEDSKTRDKKIQDEEELKRMFFDFMC